jgi:hypothetical protein
MKNVLLFSLLICSSMLMGQDISILVVDDSKDDFENTANITAGLDNSSIAYDLFDAAGTMASPTAEYMSNYDLVIWHTSTDGVGLYLWNANDEINGELALYLSEGGNLWVIGNDFLYDRYLTPYAFTEGEFAYDYLGVASYDGQTNVDDGGAGVPFVTPAADQPITGLDDIDWIFSTLYYGDVVTGIDGSVSIYEMGGAGYVLEGETTGLWNDNGTSKCLSFFFDLALASEQSIIDNTVASVVSFYAGVISSTEVLEAPAVEVSVFPNPSSDQISVQFDGIPTFTARVTNLLGQEIFVSRNLSQSALILDRDQIGTGLFMLNIEFEDENLKPVVKKILFK